MSNRYTIFPATLLSATPSALTLNLRQLESYGFSPNPTKVPFTPGGSLDAVHIGLANARPTHRFSTRDLLTILTNVSPTIGLPVDGTNPAAVFRYQQRLCNNGFDTTAVHVGRNCAGGFLKPVSIGASSSDTEGALINLELMSASDDGTTEPDTKVLGQDFGGVATPTFVSRYFFGPSYLGAVKLQGLEGVTVEFGLNCEAKLFDDVYPQCHTVNGRMPKVTFTGTNAAIDATLNSFINDLSSPFTTYFRKGSHAQSRVADATASHISVSIGSGEWSIDDENVQSVGDGQFSWSATPTGTISVNTATAIP